MYQYPMKIFLMLLFLISFSVSAKEDVVKVYDKGMDGGMRIYTVVCPNGKKTTVTQTFNRSGENADNNIRTTEVKVLDSNIDEAPPESIQEDSANLKEKIQLALDPEATIEDIESGNI